MRKPSLIETMDLGGVEPPCWMTYWKSNYKLIPQLQFGFARPHGQGLQILSDFDSQRGWLGSLHRHTLLGFILSV